MLKRSFLFAVFFLCALFALPAMAFADTGAAPVVSSLSTPLIVIALLSLISAYITQGVSSGKIWGFITIPQPWLPYLTIGGTFLSTFVAQLVAAGNISGVALFNAALSGMFMLLAPAAGTALHHHVNSPTANLAATAATAVKAAVVVIGLGFLMVTQTACGAGEIFGPGSAIPSDLQAEENCASAQVLSGNTDPTSIITVCSAQTDQTFSDLLAWIVNGLLKKGQISAERAATLQTAIAASRGAK